MRRRPAAASRPGSKSRPAGACAAFSTPRHRRPRMPEPLLAVRDLSKTYRVGRTEVAALRDVSLDLGRGECLALVGESGSGKTTLGKLVLGIEAPSAGTMHFAGAHLPERRERGLKRRLQFVQQNPMSAL
ncbi:MAG: ATP-binding cassette domain-containing protein, partial [Alphaproteobacteria bacterium]|nr:ATP-binding cassette domain-containing protein [Alphaproteobacteria bacterium]